MKIFFFPHPADCSTYATCLFNAFDPQRKGYLTFEVIIQIIICNILNYIHQLHVIFNDIVMI